MRLIRRDASGLTILLDVREKDLLFQLLSLFPSTHGPVGPASRFGDADETREIQSLLEESLADHRAEARRELQRWMEASGAIRPVEKGFHLRIEFERSEWLLQILNDIRVGSWIKLGAPAELHEPSFEHTAEQAKLWWAMEVAGFFQTALLTVLERPNQGGIG